MINHTGCHTAIAIPLHGTGGHRHHRKILQARDLADLPGRLHPVHHRHLHVHQHDVVIKGINLVQSNPAVLGQIDNEAGITEQFGCHVLVKIVVLHQQDTGALDAGQLLEGIGRRLSGGPRAGNHASQNVYDAVEEHRRIDRLDQHILNACFLRALYDLLAAESGHHYHVRHMAERKFSQSPGRLVAIHTRHFPVEKHDLIGHALFLGTTHSTDGRLARLGLIDLEAHVAKQGAQHLAGIFIVIYHQHAFADQVHSRHQIALLSGALAQSCREPKGASLAGFAVHTHLSAHQSGKLLGNGKPQPGAAKFAGNRGVGLRKSLKQPPDLLLRQAGARITDGAVNQHILFALLLETDNNINLAMLGEGDGIVTVVDKNLPQSQRIANQVGRYVRVYIEDQFQPLGGRLFSDQVGHLVKHGLQFEVYVLNHQLPLFNLREVKYIVNDTQQMSAGDLDLLDVIALTRCQLGLQRQMGHADNGVHWRSDLVTHIGEEIRFGEVGLFRHGLGLLQLCGFFQQHLIHEFALRDVAGGSEHALQPPVPIVEGGGIEGHHGFPSVPGAYGQLVVGNLFFVQHELDACVSPLRIGEVFVERRAYQFVSRAVGERLHLFVDVGDDTAGIGGHQRVDVGLKQGARIEFMVAQALTELLLLCLDQLAGGVISADQQITDDSLLLIAQGCNRHNCREAAPILADIGQFVDVLDTARGLENQGLEARRNRGPELNGQGLGTRDNLLRIGDVGRSDGVQHLGGRIAQHALGADVEDLNDALGVCCDTREIGAVENGALQCTGLEQGLFRLFTCGDIGHHDAEYERAVAPYSGSGQMDP